MKKVAAILALALAAAALVACGDDNGAPTTTEPPAGEEKNGAAGGGGAAGGQTIAFEAEPSGQLEFTETEVSAEAGKATIEFTNDAAVPHDVVIEDEGGSEIGRTEVITESTDTAEVELKAGDYTFYCSVPGHREAGMEGTLTVE